MKNLIKVAFTVLALMGLIGFAASSQLADPGSTKPGDPPDSIRYDV
jgi:hypothetical protein